MKKSIILITSIPDGSKHYSEKMDVETAKRTLAIMNKRGLKTTIHVFTGKVWNETPSL